MKTRETTPGKTYSVHTSSGCTVSDKNGWSKTIDAPDGYFTAHAGEVTIDGDDAADVREVFKLAPQQRLAILGVLGGNGGLPAGFKRVEYLQSDGGQYILTGVTLTSDAQFSFTAQQLKFKSNISDFQIGARCASAHTLFVGVGGYFSNSWQVVGGINGNYYFSKPPYSITEKVSIFLNGKQAKINGEIVNAADKHTFGTDDYNSSAITEAALFGVTRAIQNDVLICSACRIWYAELWSDLNKKADRKFVPALDPTGSPCMYDLVTKTAFRNAGEGSFVVGMTLSQVRGLRLPTTGGQLTLSLPYEASIDGLAQAALEQARANGWELTLQYAEAEVPAGYRKLDFLESTGTQWINTGIVPQCGDELKLENVTLERGSLFSSTNEGNDPKFTIVRAENSIFYKYFASGASPAFKSELLPEGSTVFCDSKGEVFVNNESVIKNYGNGVTTLPLIFFGAGSSAKIGCCVLSRAGVAQVDYVPCIAPDGKLGMYNRVDGTVQENVGKGAFIAGLATVDDVRKLWLLETGGTLTVSVPADTPDSAVEQLRKNNPTWQIAIQYRQ